jgi:hypothetical protein
MAEEPTSDHVQVLSPFLVRKHPTQIERPTLVARNRNEQIAEATRIATEQRLLQEIQRPKYLFDELQISNVKPPSFFIKEARRRRSAVPSKREPMHRSFSVSRDTTLRETPVNRSSDQRTKDKTSRNETPIKRKVGGSQLRSSHEFMQEFYPDWLKSRQDFIEMYDKMKDKSGLDVADICSRISSHRSEDEREAVTQWLEHLECFRSLPKDTLKELSGRFNTAVFKQGQARKD